MRESPTTPLSPLEAVALLGSALASVERSAHRLRCRSIDLAVAYAGSYKSPVRDAEEFMDLAGEVPGFRTSASAIPFEPDEVRAQIDTAAAPGVGNWLFWNAGEQHRIEALALRPLNIR